MTTIGVVAPVNGSWNPGRQDEVNRLIEIGLVSGGPRSNVSNGEIFFSPSTRRLIASFPIGPIRVSKPSSLPIADSTLARYSPNLNVACVVIEATRSARPVIESRVSFAPVVEIPAC